MGELSSKLGYGPTPAIELMQGSLQCRKLSPANGLNRTAHPTAPFVNPTRRGLERLGVAVLRAQEARRQLRSSASITFRSPRADEAPRTITLARSTTEEKESQFTRLADFHKRHAAEGPAALARLKQVVIDNGNVFGELVNSVRVCSIGQITNALFEVGGQYRRSMYGKNESSSGTYLHAAGSNRNARQEKSSTSSLKQHHNHKNPHTWEHAIFFVSFLISKQILFDLDVSLFSFSDSSVPVNFTLPSPAGALPSDSKRNFTLSPSILSTANFHCPLSLSSILPILTSGQHQLEHLSSH